MLIRPADETIKSVLMGANFFRIPRFQRPYSWDQTNTDEFWNDAVTSADHNYLIGSFVVYQDKKRDDLIYLVDGQQRLTTVTIILAALRNVLHEHSCADVAKGIQGLIEKKSVEGKRDYVLSPETSYPFFQDVIQRHGSPQHKHQLGAEERALKQAYDFFKAQISAVAEKVIASSSSPSKMKNLLRKKLLEIRDSVLRLRLILVTLTSDDDAYLVFETLNTRGKDLGVSDLVKNHITRILKPKNASLDDAKEKWNGIRRQIEAIGSRADIDIFLHHSWISRRPYLPKTQLFRTMRSTISKQREVTSYLSELEEDARAYATVLRPSDRKWSSQHLKLSASLQAISTFGVRQPLPFLMALVRAFDEQMLTKRQTEQMLGKLESFHAAFTGVSSKRTGGGTAAMYAAAARALLHAKDKDARHQALMEFTVKLRARLPKEAEFLANLRELIYLDSQGRDRDIMRYLLIRVDQHLRGKHATPVDYSQMTIEHLTPQTAIKAGTSQPEAIGSIGNLILVPAKLNNEKLAAKRFAEKKQLLTGNKIPMDSVLDSATSWTAAKIDQRTQEIGCLLYDKILKV